MDEKNRIEEMYQNPDIVRLRRYSERRLERAKNLTPEEARRELMKAGLIDEPGNPAKPYRQGDEDEWILHRA